jgi:uncharacterized protein (TIGR03086 family)
MSNSTIQLFQRATDYATTVVASLSSGDLQRTTPCEDWPAGRVVLHLADISDGLVGLLDTGSLALPEPARVDDPDPVSILRESMSALSAAMSTTSEADRVLGAAQAGAIEFTMHSWDIGVARDQDHETPADLADDVLALASSLITDDTRGSNFASAATVTTDTSSPSDRLAAFLGRRRPAAA